MCVWFLDGVLIGWIDLLTTRPGITSNYSATANLHNSQVTTAPTKPFPACCVFILLTVEILKLPGPSFVDCPSELPVSYSLNLNWIAMSSQAPLQSSAALSSATLFFKTELSELESELLYDYRFTANHFFLVTSPLRLTTIIFPDWTLVVMAFM
jgi:hypothetical protein